MEKVTLQNQKKSKMRIRSSADHHLEYSRAVYSRLRMNIFASNGAVFKVIGLKLAKRSSVKVWGILVTNSLFCLKMSVSGNSALRHSLDLSEFLTYQNSLNPF